jgi:hypothetical protein
MSGIGGPTAALGFVLAMIGSYAEALGADGSLALPEVTVTARPITPEWKRWNPYGGSVRVEEDKWPDIPCSA